MIETFACLLLAHALADIALQSPAMGRAKHRVTVLALHGLVVLATASLVLGSAHPAILALAVVHTGIDGVKTWARLTGPGAVLADQALHAATIVAVAWFFPGLWATGLWGGLPVWPALAALLAGLLLCVLGGSHAVGLFMARWSADAPSGLRNGGRAIGQLERGLIFLFVLTGQTQAIGLLIAAKSVLRFGAVKDDLKVSEYVIIGTLSSFAWAIVTAIFTVFLLERLAPLHIPLLTP